MVTMSFWDSRADKFEIGHVGVHRYDLGILRDTWDSGLFKLLGLRVLKGFRGSGVIGLGFGPGKRPNFWVVKEVPLV